MGLPRDTVCAVEAVACFVLVQVLHALFDSPGRRQKQKRLDELEELSEVALWWRRHEARPEQRATGGGGTTLTQSTPVKFVRNRTAWYFTFITCQRL